MEVMRLYAVENVKAGSELPEGAGRSLSPPSGLNRYPAPSGDSSPMRPVYAWMNFGNHNIRISGESEVTGSGSGRSLVSSHWNRPLEKAEKDRGGNLGGCVVDGM